MFSRFRRWLRTFRLLSEVELQDALLGLDSNYQNFRDESFRPHRAIAAKMYAKLVAQVRLVYQGSLDDIPISRDMVELIYDSYAMVMAHPDACLLATFPMEQNKFALNWTRRTLSSECVRVIFESTLGSDAYLVLAVVKSKWEVSREKLESLPKSRVTKAALEIGTDFGGSAFAFRITNIDLDGAPMATPCIVVPGVEIKPGTRLCVDCYPMIHQTSLGVPSGEIVPFMVCGIPPIPEYRGHIVNHCGVSTIVAERFVKMARSRIPLFTDIQARIESRKAKHDDE